MPLRRNCSPVAASVGAKGGWGGARGGKGRSERFVLNRGFLLRGGVAGGRVWGWLGVDAREFKMETCANCEASIGKLENPQLYWHNQRICGTCYDKLVKNERAVAADEPPAVRQSTWSPMKQATHPTFKTKPAMPPTLRAMAWIGLVLWIPGGVFFAAFGGGMAIPWLGAILCIGSLVAWAIIRAVRES